MEKYPQLAVRIYQKGCFRAVVTEISNSTRENIQNKYIITLLDVILKYPAFLPSNALAIHIAIYRYNWGDTNAIFNFKNVKITILLVKNIMLTRSHFSSFNSASIDQKF